MSIYDVDIDLLTKRTLPTRKREPIHIDWLSSILKGLKSVYGLFISFKAETLSDLSYNAQRLIFEKALNDKCDPSLRRIFIDNSFDNTPQEHSFLRSEGFPLYTYTRAESLPVYSFSKPEYESDFDFIIFVPTALSSETDKITGLGNFYKLASTRFKIELY